MTVEDKERGLFKKFHVTRVDGKDAPCQPKEGARYLVLDVVHDPYARPAAAVYASLCHKTHGPLADDLWDLLDLTTAGTKDHPNKVSPDALVTHVLDVAAAQHAQSEAGGEAMGYNVGHHTRRRVAALTAMAEIWANVDKPVPQVDSKSAEELGYEQADMNDGIMYNYDPECRGLRDAILKQLKEEGVNGDPNASDATRGILANVANKLRALHQTRTGAKFVIVVPSYKGGKFKVLVRRETTGL